MISDWHKHSSRKPGSGIRKQTTYPDLSEAVVVVSALIRNGRSFKDAIKECYGFSDSNPFSYLLRKNEKIQEAMAVRAKNLNLKTSRFNKQNLHEKT